MGTVRYTVVDGEMLAEKRGGVRRSYVPDPLGSTVALLDNTQTQTDTFTYWPYGEVKTRTGATATPFQFVGALGYYKDSSNRDYVRARHLRKDISRWQTEDPIGFFGGDFNLARYVWNRPVSWLDRTGHAVYECCQNLGHCFISTHKCGAWGFHPRRSSICSLGHVQSDDYGLRCEVLDVWDPKRHRKWPKLVCFPGEGAIGDDGKPAFSCREIWSDLPIGDSYRLEDAICGCIAKSRDDSKHNRLWFCGFGNNCRDWTGDMMRCADEYVKQHDEVRL